MATSLLPHSLRSWKQGSRRGHEPGGPGVRAALLPPTNFRQRCVSAGSGSSFGTSSYNSKSNLHTAQRVLKKY